ncbi:hypothetical protein CFP65_2101 [Kitasatospora sp. MMS16-BH015]|nr:hypothetical protein CFP65_2101 [Kitasatospora sp. MMS16-BH015]
MDDEPNVDGTLVEVARAAVHGAGSRGGDGGWEFTVEGFWCTARPLGTRTAPPVQGWKLHVSAAAEVAEQVLAAVAGVLADDPCTFKFAADRERLHEVNSRNSERGSAGKYITAYPADEAQFGRLAERLHRATEDLPGPGVLSDRPYAPGSRVSYRYGVFTGRAELGNDGAYRSMLTGPDGQRAEDLRTAGYRCPPWLVDPVEGRGSTAGTAAAQDAAAGGAGKPRGGGVLLGGRYALTAAVRHSTKGGIFLGKAVDSGAEVVVKQARAHIEVDRSGREARTALRHEAMLLTRLDGQRLTPRPIELIEQDDNLFLIQERIPGLPLASWVAGRLRRDGTPDVAWAEAGPIALALTEQLQRVHAQGLVLRDLSPTNVMVQPDGELRFVDLELAATAGSTAGTAGTPGYRAPEQGPGDTTAVADHSADLYALGGLFFLLATGHDPLLPEDTPLPRPAGDRIGRWLELAARNGDTARRLAPVILALRAEDPGRRWSLARVKEALTGCAAAPVGHPAPVTPLADQLVDRVIRDGLRHLAATATPERRDRLWPTVPAGQLTDPCNVQHGAAGVLAVLARAVGTGSLPGVERELALETAALAADWIERRCAAEPTALPGLHFGRSGIAWALLDAAEALGDARLAARAVTLARTVPYVWPNPDVCHGAAGAGFLQLRLHRSTGAADYLDRAAVCADGLLGAAHEEPYGTVWSVPKTFDSSLAGVTHLGYGHGVAGIGAYLLAAGRPEAALRAARTLAATVRTTEGDSTCWWPQSAGDPEHIRLQHWCNGSSGVGSFLIRLWQATGDPDARRLALGAGEAVLAGRWHSGTSACHGLAGNGEFLLDLAEATGAPRYRTGAEELARLILARAGLRDGLLVLPDETGLGLAPAYGTGYSGALAFLLRLRHGGSRLWLDS